MSPASFPDGHPLGELIHLAHRSLDAMNDEPGKINQVVATFADGLEHLRGDPSAFLRAGVLQNA